MKKTWIQMSALAALITVYANANPILPQNYTQDTLTDSIGLYLTNRGQSFLSNDLLQTLLINGIALGSGSINQWLYPSTGYSAPLDLDNLPLGMQQHASTLGSIKTQLMALLSGFSFNNPELKVTVNGISYQAKIDRLGITPNYSESQAVNEANTVVMDAQFEISSFHVGVDSIRVTDQANPMLGVNELGADNITIDMSEPPVQPPLKSPEPLTITIPLAISLDSDHRIQIKALSITDNLDSMLIQMALGTMDFPPLKIIVENTSDPAATQTIQPNIAAIESLIRQQLPSLTKVLQTYLDNYIQQNGTGLVDQAIASQFSVNSLFQEVNTMSPPGAPATLSNPAPYIWGLIPDKFNIDKNFLSLQISTFVEDSQSKKNIPLPSQDGAKTAPNLSAVDPSTYDVAMKLDEGFVNRLLQLSFLRGYFVSIPEPGSEPIKMANAPLLLADGTTSPNMAKLHLTILYEDEPGADIPGNGVKHFLEKELAKLDTALVIKNPLEISFDMEVKIQVDPTTNTIVLIEGPIDVNSGSINPKYIKIQSFKSNVMTALKTALTEHNAAAQMTPSILTNPIAVPQSIAGVPIGIKDVQADPSGNFMLYLQYQGLN